MIYLDAAAAEKPSDHAFYAFKEVLRICPYNPNSEHREGEKARNALEKGKWLIAECLSCKPDEVHFTSTASEAAAWAMHTMSENCNKIHVNPTEHHCVLEYQIPPASTGKKYPRGVAQMLANNETGDIYDHAPQDGELWLCDATAAVGHIPVSFSALGCDYMIGDAMKFGGIPGAAFLIARHGAPLSQLIYGSPLRGGTPSVALIHAMAAALRERVNNMEEIAKPAGEMKKRMARAFAEQGALLNTDMDNSLPHILNVSFPGVDGKTLALLLSHSAGVMVSAGAACTSGDNAPSHVLMAKYSDEARARSAIRISIPEGIGEDKIDDAVIAIINSAKYLKGLV